MQYERITQALLNPSESHSSRGALVPVYILGTTLIAAGLPYIPWHFGSRPSCTFARYASDLAAPNQT